MAGPTLLPNQQAGTSSRERRRISSDPRYKLKNHFVFLPGRPRNWNRERRRGRLDRLSRLGFVSPYPPFSFIFVFLFEVWDLIFACRPAFLFGSSWLDVISSYDWTSLVAVRCCCTSFRKASILAVAHALFAEMTRHGDAKRVRRICIRLCIGARNNLGFGVFVGLGFEWTSEDLPNLLDEWVWLERFFSLICLAKLLERLINLHLAWC